MANIMIDIAAEFVGNKAFKQADTATDKLTKNVKTLAKTFGLAFSSAAVIAYGKNAVKAAAADEKAQKQLALALKNVGLGRDAASSEAYIQRLQTEFGILDDDLRPAYQGLAVAVQDTDEAQRLLNLALDISASTGKDLGSVTAALSKAYLGNNTALSKLGVGISKADLKSKSFKTITDQLTTTFAGSATAAANSYQGSIDKLAVASANASEIIGTGLIDALKGLGDQESVDDLAKSMEAAAQYTADVIRGIGVLTEKLKSLPGVSSFNIGMIPIVGSYFQILRDLGRVTSKLDYTAAASATAFEKGFGLSSKIVKNAKVLTAEEQKQLKAKQQKLAIDKANLALGKATDVFDIEKIQLEAARISQAEQLGKVTSQAQLLQITNDLARLRVKQSILDLEEAIASGDLKAITNATNKLNADLGILGALNGQAMKLVDIKKILDSIAPKDLINLANLNEAIRLLGLINGSPRGSSSTTTSTSTSSLSMPVMPASLNPAQGVSRANQPTGFSNAELQYFEDRDQALYGYLINSDGTFKNQSSGNVNVTIQANTIANPDELVNLVQDTLIKINRRGGSLVPVGTL
jgi:hypothetical protein